MQTTCRLSHGNLSSSAIFCAPDGSWRLGGLEFCHSISKPLPEIAAPFLDTASGSTSKGASKGGLSDVLCYAQLVELLAGASSAVTESPELSAALSGAHIAGKVSPCC